MENDNLCVYNAVINVVITIMISSPINARLFARWLNVKQVLLVAQTCKHKPNQHDYNVISFKRRKA